MFVVVLVLVVIVVIIIIVVPRSAILQAKIEGGKWVFYQSREQQINAVLKSAFRDGYSWNDLWWRVGQDWSALDASDQGSFVNQFVGSRSEFVSAMNNDKWRLIAEERQHKAARAAKDAAEQQSWMESVCDYTSAEGISRSGAQPSCYGSVDAAAEALRAFLNSQPRGDSCSPPRHKVLDKCVCAAGEDWTGRDCVPARRAGFMTFYMYRAQDGACYDTSNVGMADLSGIMTYTHSMLHSVPQPPGKPAPPPSEDAPPPPQYAEYQACDSANLKPLSITRITRWLVTMKITHHAIFSGKKFSDYVAFDSGRCTVPGCSERWESSSYQVGCQGMQMPGYEYTPESCTGAAQGHWYSLPGACPDEVLGCKSHECIHHMPGGDCNGHGSSDSNCFYTTHYAGEISLKQMEHFATAPEVRGPFKPGSFWDRAGDLNFGKWRMRAVTEAQKASKVCVYFDPQKTDELGTIFSLARIGRATADQLPANEYADFDSPIREYIRFEIVDFNCKALSKTVPGRHRESSVFMYAGALSTGANQEVLVIPEEILAAGCPNTKLVPDWSTEQVLPWACRPEKGIRVKRVYCEQANLEVVPRTICRRMLKELGAFDGQGLQMLVGGELEFVLAKPEGPSDSETW
ncbi:unnamed protein product, partial [Polarella glacialis]